MAGKKKGGDGSEKKEQPKQLPIDPARYELLLQGLACYVANFKSAGANAEKFVEELLESSQMATLSKMMVAKKEGINPDQLNGFVLAKIPVPALELIAMAIAAIGVIMQSEPTMAVIYAMIEKEKNKRDPRRN